MIDLMELKSEDFEVIRALIPLLRRTPIFFGNVRHFSNLNTSRKNKVKSFILLNTICDGGTGLKKTSN